MKLSPDELAKVRRIVDGVCRAKCRYCGKAGVTLLCACPARLELARRNCLSIPLRDGLYFMHGPIGKLP